MITELSPWYQLSLEGPIFFFSLNLLSLSSSRGWIYLLVSQFVNNVPGRKSEIGPPPKLASSVAYPFAIVRPCGVHGDVTLRDINQRMRTPPPPKMKQSNEDPSASYPTSAFSGKPVVGKMKIRTEGGKGSITVMRTKGWCWGRSS